MEGESGVIQSIIDELLSSDIQRDQMEGRSGVTRSISDGRHSLDIQGDEMEGENGLLQVSMTNFMLRISNEVKWKAKMV